MILIRLRTIARNVRLFWHTCKFEHLERKHISVVNSDPNANDNPLSIYGPEGSYWLELYRCKVCGHISGRRYDTYGGWSVTDWEAKHHWLKEEQEPRKATLS